LKIGFKYGDRISEYLFVSEKEGYLKHRTVQDGEGEGFGPEDVLIDVHESNPDIRKKARWLLTSHKIFGELYAEEMFCEMHAWQRGGIEGSRRNLEALSELYTGMEMSEEHMEELRLQFESMDSEKPRSGSL